MEQLLAKLSNYPKEMSEKIETLVVTARLLGYSVKVKNVDDIISFYIANRGLINIYYILHLDKLVISIEGAELMNDLAKYHGRTNYARLASTRIENKDRSQMAGEIQALIDIL